MGVKSRGKQDMRVLGLKPPKQGLWLDVTLPATNCERPILVKLGQVVYYLWVDSSRALVRRDRKASL